MRFHDIKHILKGICNEYECYQKGEKLLGIPVGCDPSHDMTSVASLIVIHSPCDVANVCTRIHGHDDKQDCSNPKTNPHPQPEVVPIMIFAN